MEINYCKFPDNLLYDSEGFIWVSKEGNLARIGVTSIHSALAGKVSSVTFKDVSEIEKGRGICSIESPTHFSIARVPIRGKFS
jgi:glycine cleavage system H lipoate-binding protein